MRALRRFFQRLISWTTSARDEEILRAEFDDHVARQTGAAEPELPRVLMVTHGVLDALDVKPLLGRWFSQPDDNGKADEQYPDLSPDGRWIAYASNESGRSEVYVQPFPALGSRHQISTDGGTAPAWSRDGRELFYTTTETFGGQSSPTRMMAVSVATAPGFVASPPRVLFEGRYGATGVVRPYDVSADGQRFLMVKQKERAPISASQMILVQNWLEEVKARVGVD
jgi:hypothetical protein